MENEKKYFTGLIDKVGKREKSSDEILRDLERRRNLLQSPIKSQDYASEIDRTDEIMRVKGGTEKIDTKTPTEVLPNSTEKIDTKQIAKISKPEDITNKVDDFRQTRNLEETYKAAMKTGDTATAGKVKTILGKMGKSLPKLAVVGALGNALFNTNEASASERIGDVAGVVGELATPMGFEVGSTGYEKGSLENKLEMGTITPEEREQLYRQSLENLRSK